MKDIFANSLTSFQLALAIRFARVQAVERAVGNLKSQVDHQQVKQKSTASSIELLELCLCSMPFTVLGSLFMS